MVGFNQDYDGYDLFVIVTGLLCGLTATVLMDLHTMPRLVSWLISIQVGGIIWVFWHSFWDRKR